MGRLTRRDFLAASALLGGSARVGSAKALGAFPASSALQPAHADYEWLNWSKGVRAKPRHMARPETSKDVVAAVRESIEKRLTLRVAGTGHSFTPLCATDGALLVENRLRGIEAIDEEEHLVTVLAGTRLYQLHRPLEKAGWSMINLPDIDRQTVAGAIATSTHGTGPTLGSLSTQVAAVELVTGQGEVLELSESERPDLLKAVRVHLGALGVLTKVTLRVLPSYRLHERTWIASYQEMMEQLDEQIASHRHFEFFWVSGRDACLMKALNPSDDPKDLERFDDAQNLSGERRGHSSQVFPSARHTPFNEIEYSLPAARGKDCLAELRALMLGKHRAITWPLEYRTVAADDACLSPAYGRPTVTISAHQAAELEHQPFFDDVEAVFRNHQGRPHWGKMHSLESKQLRPLYPEWQAFTKARRELDPKGLFLSPYLEKLLL